MGTNYYLMTDKKEIAEKLFEEYTLTDTPFWGYELHIAKCSAGWLPLFHFYRNFSSVSEILKNIKENNLRIFDEYERELSLDDFIETVVNHNGGVKGKIKPRKTGNEIYKNSPFFDPDMPDYIPVSHFDYAHGKYADRYIKDSKGYEFCPEDFC